MGAGASRSMGFGGRTRGTLLWRHGVLEQNFKTDYAGLARTDLKLDDLKATERQLERFLDFGVLDSDSLEFLHQEIATRRRRLLGRKEVLVHQSQPLLPFPTTTSASPKPVESKILTVLPVESVPSAPPQAAVALPEPILLTPRETLNGAQHPAVLALPIPVPVPVPVAPPRPPRRSMREILASFMEHRNIFWGELLGGLLIVGCSIALVISLWMTGKLEKIPFAPFLILALITASLFGVGWYTLRHWKLELTSQGLLIIATLLVPLNFLVIAGLHGQESSGWEIPLEVVALIAFAWLTSLAGGALLADRRWL